MKMTNYLLLLLLCLISIFGSVFTVIESEIDSERGVLLEFKASVSDPNGILSSWVSSSGSNHCEWFGVTCDVNSRVTSICVDGVGGNFTKNGCCFDVLKLPLYGLGFRRRCGIGKIRGKLIGGLSPAIAKLKRLRVLSLPFHELSGEIPSEIWGLKSLEVFDLEGNLISGELPDSITGLRNLRILNLGLNRIGGMIPDSFMRLVSLEALNLAGNELEGVIPEFVGGLRMLRGLYLSFNRLKGKIPDVRGRNCVKLRFLDLSGNGFRGRVPPSLGECRGLEVVLLFSNALEGDIPREFGRLRKLRVLDVSRNRLGGYIPAQLGNCLDLSVLVLSYYDDLVRVSRDAYNHGERNLFRGSIPMEILALSNLKIIWAPKAGLEGEIHGSWECCRSLVIVNLSHNSLAFGSLNGIFKSCKSLVYAVLSSNKKSLKHIDNLQNLVMKRFNIRKVPGFASSECFSLFSRISNSLQNDEALSAYFSFFVGRACSETSSFLSKVQLLGDKYTAYTQWNVRKYGSARLLSELSSSSVDQTAPSSNLQSNSEDLQAGAQSPSRNGSGNTENKFNTIEIASIVSASVIVLVLLALVILFIYTRKCAPRESSRIQVYERKEIRVFNSIEVPLTYQNVVKATDCFSAGNCIGCGGFGATYKAEISSGVVVAVKRLAVGRFHCIQQFHAEIKTLSRIKHPNLVTLIGYHASETEMFLIYNYLPGGNLEKFIQERVAKAIKWKILHKIALDIAHAIAYLHDECNPRVIHRDVKPSNILLDNEFNAYLSDFGLSRLLENSETHATTGVAGTFGYLAPEYAMTCRVSEKADVYSYGVVLLELISDKKALDPSFSSHGNGFNIVSWAHMLLRQGRAKEVFTAGIWDSGPHDDLVEVLHLAVKCTVDSLSIRPTMKQVVELLKQVRPLS